MLGGSGTAISSLPFKPTLIPSSRSLAFIFELFPTKKLADCFTLITALNYFSSTIFVIYPTVIALNYYNKAKSASRSQYYGFFKPLSVFFRFVYYVIYSCIF